MVSTILAFVAGVVAAQWQQVLPPLWLCGLIPLLLFALWRSTRLRLPLALACGFLWACLLANLHMAGHLPSALEGRPLLVEGVVDSLPDQDPQPVRFNFRIERLVGVGERFLLPARVRLSWYRTKQRPKAGERWRFRVKLKRPHGFMNPGGLDYEGWLFRNRLVATGYIRNDPGNQKLLDAGWGSLFLHWREEIRARILGHLGASPARDLLIALTVGDRSGLDRSQWRVFVRTGTNHLMAISGLHIGIVSGLIFLLVRRLWCYSASLCLLFPAAQAAALFALVAATVYAGLAGFAVPTLRALLMLGVMMGGVLLRRPFSFSLSLAYALLLVTVCDPYAVQSAGFWLSFAAVGAILYGLTGRVSKPERLRGWIRMQWVVALALAPLLLLWGMRLSLLAPLVNLFAVPLFSLLLVPLALIAVLFDALIPAIGQPLLDLAALMLNWSYAVFVWLAEFPLATFSPPEAPVYVWGIVALGVVLLLSPAGTPGKWPAALLLLLPVVWMRTVPSKGEFFFTLLDVGQGLSAVVETQGHLLVYDAGPRFSRDFDAGSAAVAPFLKARGVKRIDRLILSNADSDHSGGFESLSQAMEVASVWSGEAERFTARPVLPCVAGVEWSWDDVQFKVLHPDGSGRWQGNDASCVLLVKNAHRQLLLTGDIGVSVEAHLLERFGRELKGLDLLVVPHHGSLSSSSEAFVQQVAPRYALISSGYRNRYGFPKARVVARWRAVASNVVNTVEAGAISFSSATGVLERYRCSARRYWHWQPEPGLGGCD